MRNVIGFTNKFYTLWNHTSEEIYKMDSYGKYHVIGVNHKYRYIKNISFSLDKVKQLYPDTTIDMELRGTKSFMYNEKYDLPKGYFWFGKYYGKKYEDIIESDFNYCIWVAREYTIPEIKEHPKYIAYIESLEKAKQDVLDKSTLLKEGDTVELNFVTNGYNALDDYSECWATAYYGETEIKICCPGAVKINSIYPYIMPMINGVAKRTKNKTVKVTVTEVFDTNVYKDQVVQSVKVK